MYSVRVNKQAAILLPGEKEEGRKEVTKLRKEEEEEEEEEAAEHATPLPLALPNTAEEGRKEAVNALPIPPSFFSAVNLGNLRLKR